MRTASFGFAAAIGLLCVGGVNAQSWACVADQSTGFRFDAAAKSWKGTNFLADDKYIITKSDDGKAKWLVKRTGLALPIATCPDDFSEGGILSCRGYGFIEFLFNRNNGRFLSAYLYGFVFHDAGAEGKDTPALTIGKCSKL